MVVSPEENTSVCAVKTPFLHSLIELLGWLVVLGFNTILTAKVGDAHDCFLAFSHQYLRNFSLQSHRLLYSHASAEVRGENMPERKFASTES